MTHKFSSLALVFSVLLSLVFSPQPSLAETQAANPVVQGMLDQVKQADLLASLNELTGEQAAVIGGKPYTITTRYTLSTLPISKATQYAYERLDALGLDVNYHTYIHPWNQATKRNVIAEQPGLGQPERLFLVTAHLDSTSNAPGYDPAPGADDNATGSVAVLTAARILSQYDFDCTIRYALFTGEEQGLYGSIAYAQSLRDAGVAVEGVLNLDMLGYNTPSTSPTLELHTRPANTGDLAIANAFVSTVSDYALNLVPQVLQDGERYSDHAPFWDRQYPAIMAIEDWSDHTPHYHRSTDTVSSLNLAYYTEFVKAAVGTMARLGCLLDGQVQGVVSAGSQPLPGVTVEARQAGQVIGSTTTAANGAYRLLLLPGSYDITFSGEGRASVTVPAVPVVKEASVTLNQDLAPCDTLSGLTFSAVPGQPIPGQVVTFSATAYGAAPVQYTWSFGDGAVAEGPQVQHAYSDLGLYTVTVTGDNICARPFQQTGNLVVAQYVMYMPLIKK